MRTIEGETVPSGWLLCDGSPVPAGAGFDALRAKVGDTLPARPTLRGEDLAELDRRLVRTNPGAKARLDAAVHVDRFWIIKA